MPLLVHLGDARETASFRRSGLKLPRLRAGRAPGPTGIYAMPVLPSYEISHQWLRELKRNGVRAFVGVYFRIGDDEPVQVGHYSQAHQTLTAAAAVSVIIAAADPRGFEIIVPRKILPGEIHAIRPVQGVIGWRYFPDAHGRTPCGCPFCQRSQYGGRKLRAAYERP